MTLQELLDASALARDLDRLATMHSTAQSTDIYIDTTNIEDISDAAWDRAREATRREFIADLRQQYRDLKSKLNALGITGIPEIDNDTD